jgi:hypothetical protein
MNVLSLLCTLLRRHNMETKDFVLGVLSLTEKQGLSPVQVQKLFFLLDKNIADEIGGIKFNFQPWSYGPFDSEVYNVLETLENEDFIKIDREKQWNIYKISENGTPKAKALFEELSPKAKEYIQKAFNFVVSLSFTDLVRAIYKEYPDMKVNSVFTR